MLVSRKDLSYYLEILDRYNLGLSRLNNTVAIYLRTGNSVIQEAGLAFLNINLLNSLKNNLRSNLGSIIFSLELDPIERGYPGWEVLKILSGYFTTYHVESPTKDVLLELNKIKEIVALSYNNFIPTNSRNLNLSLNSIREYKLSSRPISTIFLPVSIHKTLIYSIKKFSSINSVRLTELVGDELEFITKNLVTVYRYLVELMYEEWIGVAIDLINLIKRKIEEILSYQNKLAVSFFIEDIKQLEVNTTSSIEEYLYQLDRINKVCSVTQTMLV